MTRLRPLIFLFVIALGFSCTSQKKLNYFQSQRGEDFSKVSVTQDFEIKLMPHDILQFNVFVENPEAFPSLKESYDRLGVDNRSAYEKGFVMDHNGFVDFPLIGRVNLSGLTIIQAKDTLAKRFKYFMDTPIITLKKISFKITVLGEVVKPGLYYVPNEQLTFTEALAMAGDLTNYGRRNEIQVYRKTSEGYVVHSIDLTKRDFFNTELYYVHPEDIIYVKALKRKALANVGPAVLVVTSVLSTTILAITLITRF
ncbi:MAG TPA: polysaccharide biosynthesis/export family protein [Bacteroidia bacterium]|nr:polysaccharide biosynthesis/export family protein [Bacteroidia bacterium]HNT79275.1 polysaccharide biosynthesis/export family protein [Bacteroidia bacterium]